MRPRAFRSPALSAILFAALVVAAISARSQAPAVSAEERAAFHQDPQWQNIEPHLPNPQTASPAQLEVAADVLRARRFPQDALDYYGYALARGGNVSKLLNKMGVVRLELRQVDLARELFLRTVRARKNDAEGWNNLGVTDYIAKRYATAINEYRRAAKLNKKSAVYHSNLGMAYFESADMESARGEFAKALLLDPEAFTHRDSGGSTAHVIGTQNYAQLAFEMARVYARAHDDAETILWLSKATEAGYDTRTEMDKDGALRAYSRDPRVLMMLKNTQQMRLRAVAAALPAQSLGPAAQEKRD